MTAALLDHTDYQPEEIVRSDADRTVDLTDESHGSSDPFRDITELLSAGLPVEL